MHSPAIVDKIIESQRKCITPLHLRKGSVPDDVFREVCPID
jgi:hypothetical protein